MQKLRDLTENEIAALTEEAGQPSYRAGQVFKWAQNGARSFDEMTDVPKSLRVFLADRTDIRPPALLKRQIARDGTRKYLWGLADGNCIETVLMQYRHGCSV